MTSGQQDATSTESSLFNKEPANNGLDNLGNGFNNGVNNSLDGAMGLKEDLPGVNEDGEVNTTLLPTTTSLPLDREASSTTAEPTTTTMETTSEAPTTDGDNDADAPEVDTPGTDGVTTEAPNTDGDNDADVPGVKIPGTDGTTTEAPKTDGDKDADAPGVKIPGTEAGSPSTTLAPGTTTEKLFKTTASGPAVNNGQSSKGATKGQTSSVKLTVPSAMRIPGFLSDNFHPNRNVQQKGAPAVQQTKLPNQTLNNSVRGVLLEIASNTGDHLTEQDRRTLRDFVQLVNSNQSELKANLVINMAKNELQSNGLASAPACGTGEFAPLNFNLEDRSGVNLTQEHAKIFETVVQKYGIETRGKSEILIKIINTQQQTPENISVTSRDTCGRPTVVEVHINSMRMPTPLQVLAHINRKMPQILGIDDFVHFKNIKGEPLFKDHTNMDLNKLPKVVKAALEYLNCPDMSSEFNKSHLAAVNNYVADFGFTTVGNLRLVGTGWYQIKQSAMEQAKNLDALMRKTNQGCLYEGIKGL